MVLLTSHTFCGLNVVGAHQHNLRLFSSGAPLVHGGSLQYQFLPDLVKLDKISLNDGNCQTERDFKAEKFVDYLW